MNKFLGLAAGSLLAAVAVPSLAQAQTAYTTSYVNLRAGPGLDYPVVMMVPAQVPLQQYGCLDDWSWCDVSFNGLRGWMSGQYVAYVYNDQWIPVYDYGPRYHVPVITFEFGTYWDRYYRNRPFYHERDRWARYDHDHHDQHQAPPHVAMPRQLPHGYVQQNSHSDRNDHNDRNTRFDRTNTTHSNDRGDNGRTDTHTNTNTNTTHTNTNTTHTNTTTTDTHHDNTNVNKGRTPQTNTANNPDHGSKDRGKDRGKDRNQDNDNGQQDHR